MRLRERKEWECEAERGEGGCMRVKEEEGGV